MAQTKNIKFGKCPSCEKTVDEILNLSVDMKIRDTKIKSILAPKTGRQKKGGKVKSLF